MSRITRKTTDLRPFRTIIKASNVPLDVTRATVEFRMAPAVPGQAATVVGAGSVVQTGTDPTFVNKGMVEYVPVGNDVATPGVYRVEWHIVFDGDPTPYIFPSEGYNDLVLQLAL